MKKASEDMSEIKWTQERIEKTRAEMVEVEAQERAQSMGRGLHPVRAIALLDTLENERVGTAEAMRLLGEERTARASAERARDMAGESIRHLEGILRAGDAALEAAGVANDGSAIATRVGLVLARCAEVKATWERFEVERDKAQAKANWLESIVRDGNAVLEAAGIDVRGSSLAERIGALAKRCSKAESEARTLAKLNDAGHERESGLAREVDRLRADLQKADREVVRLAAEVDDLRADKRDLKTRLGALLSPVDVDDAIDAAAAAMVEALPGVPLVDEIERAAGIVVRPHVEREAMLAREVARLTASVADLRKELRNERTGRPPSPCPACGEEFRPEARPVLSEDQAREMLRNLWPDIWDRVPVALRDALEDLLLRVSRGDFGAGEQPEASAPKDEQASAKESGPSHGDGDTCPSCSAIFGRPAPCAMTHEFGPPADRADGMSRAEFRRIGEAAADKAIVNERLKDLEAFWESTEERLLAIGGDAADLHDVTQRLADRLQVLEASAKPEAFVVERLTDAERRLARLEAAQPARPRVGRWVEYEGGWHVFDGQGQQVSGVSTIADGFLWWARRPFRARSNDWAPTLEAAQAAALAVLRTWADVEGDEQPAAAPVNAGNFAERQRACALQKLHEALIEADRALREADRSTISEALSLAWHGYERTLGQP